MKVKFFEIDWDTEDSSDEMTDVPPPDLPNEVVMDVPNDAPQANNYGEMDEYLAEEGANILSDRYGFCVNGCNYEMLPD